jgi:hypothetical protein
MPFNQFVLYKDNPPASELRDVERHLREIQNDCDKLMNAAREVALMLGCSAEDLLPSLYDEHWEPLRWRMRTMICKFNRSREDWMNKEIQTALNLIEYEPIRNELEEIWSGFKLAMEEAEKAGKALEWDRSGRLKDNAIRTGKTMSDADRRHAFDWMMGHEGKPEDVSWADAVMEIWKETMMENRGVESRPVEHSSQ